MNSQLSKTAPMFSFYPSPFFHYFNYGLYCPFQSYKQLKENTTGSFQNRQVTSSSQKPSQELLTPTVINTPKENEDKIINKSKRVGKINRRIQNQDYKPYERKRSKKITFLKENRNVLPIKIRQILSFLAREKKSLEIIKKYIKKNLMEVKFNQKRFYTFLKMKKENMGNYVTLASLRSFLSVEPEKIELYSLNQQFFYLKFVRVVFKYYLQNQWTLCSLTSTRIQRQQKIEHVKVRRDLMAFLFKGEDGSEVY